ncbi:DUF4760 domain-containing protein [Escherichia coli]|nr:DUF4760 domain-containing protein [Escherichia coli]
MQILSHLAPFATPIVASVAALIAYHNWKRQKELHREKMSLDFQSYYQNDKEIVKHRENLNYLFRHHPDIKDNIEELAIGNDFYESMIFVLNTWERCAHSVRKGVYSEQFLYDIYGSNLIGTYDKLERLIDRRRLSNERVFDNVLWLALRWKLRRKIEMYDSSFLKERGDMSFIYEFSSLLTRQREDELNESQLDSMKWLYKEIDKIK